MELSECLFVKSNGLFVVTNELKMECCKEHHHISWELLVK